ncbi:hypothetical protein, partial [Pseudomonas viridiflava]|uniref:hypothetical protein n=1 Tax=Pseudomonas viridiflava TaxID=33069 RepID=UPI00197F2AA5
PDASVLPVPQDLRGHLHGALIGTRQMIGQTTRAFIQPFKIHSNNEINEFIKALNAKTEY